MVVFVVKCYSVREAKKWRYAVRNAKIERYAVRKGGGGVTLYYLSNTNAKLVIDNAIAESRLRSRKFVEQS